jgi:hypothetical protein
MKKVSILNMSEDLLREDPIQGIPQTHWGKSKVTTTQIDRVTKQFSIEILIKEVAGVLGINAQELNDWVKNIHASTEVLKNILLTAKRFKLNPILGHIAWEINKENDWEIYIPIDGWIALIHREPTFKGLGFQQAPETENAIPNWMECTIYRSDLDYPVTVREYYAELKTDHPMWIEMPYRMLRHKTLQQCARLAFGISMQELKIPLTPHNTEELLVAHPSHSTPNRKAMLRQKLNGEGCA